MGHNAFPIEVQPTLHVSTATPAFSETPTEAEIEAALPASVMAGWKVQYNTPEGQQIYYDVIGLDTGGLRAIRETDIVLDYTTTPDATNFAPSYFITEGRSILRQNNLTSTAFITIDDGSGGGADGNGLIVGAGDTIPANQHRYVAGSLWFSPTTGRTVPANPDATNMAAAGFTNALAAAAGVTDMLRDPITATAAGQANYVLSSTPTDPESLFVQIPGSPVQTDFTLTGNTVTLAPSVAAGIDAGDVLTFTYF